MAKTKAVLKALATNRATYRFLAAVLLAAGVTAGSQWVGGSRLSYALWSLSVINAIMVTIHERKT